MLTFLGGVDICLIGAAPQSKWALIGMIILLTVSGIGFGYAIARLQNEGQLRFVNRVLEQKMALEKLSVLKPVNPNDAIGILVNNLNLLTQTYQTAMDAASRRADELAMINLLVTTINRTLDLQEVLDTSLREVMKAVQWDVGAIYMWDERTEALNMVSYRGLTEHVVRKNISYRLGEGFVGTSAETREIVISTPPDSTVSHDSSAAPGWPYLQISIPLVSVPGLLLGTLIMGSHEVRDVPDTEMTVLMTVAAQISLAIDKAQLYTQVSEHAVELESLVAARTEQLSHAINELWIALKEAREADRVKSLLLSTVSHELRTPLATIKGSTSLLIEHDNQIPPAQRVEHLRDIDEEADKLTELISNLLEMSRIQAGILHIQAQPIDLAQVLESATSRAKLRLKRHDLESEIPGTRFLLMGDVRRIEQILANLLDNAAKFSPEGSSITVRLGRKGGYAVVSVADEGVGISSEHLSRIFDRFYQVNMSSDSGRHGIGLGLAICRALIEAHGGKIWADSNLGAGSRFYFSLPLLKKVKSDRR